MEVIIGAKEKELMREISLLHAKWAARRILESGISKEEALKALEEYKKAVL